MKNVEEPSHFVQQLARETLHLDFLFCLREMFCHRCISDTIASSVVFR